MSAEATFWAWRQELKHTTKIVLLALADYNSPSGECYPSSESLAKKTGLSKRQVLREIDVLIETNLMTVTKAVGRSNRYHLNIKSGDTQSPVTDSHQCHTVTTPVTDSHQSGDTQSPELKKNLKSNLAGEKKRISTDRSVASWQPSTETINALKTLHGTPIDFINQQIPEFKIYWGDRGGEAVSWNAKFLKSCAGQWQRNKHTYQPEEVKTWQSSQAGIIEKGNELGIIQGDDEPFPMFKQRVLELAGENHE